MSVKCIGRQVATLNLSVGSQAPIGPERYGQGRGGRPWARLRKAVLERDRYQCVPCRDKGDLTMATQVDHITPKSEGGTDQMSNLQSICDTCHKVKTADESRRGVKRAFGLDDCG